MTLANAISRLPYEGPVFEPGHVWLAGAGPGGIGCLTLDVVHALGAADTVVHDALVEADVLRAAPQAERYFVGKRGGRPSAAQSDINALIIELARAGRRVLRLKGGDPNMFGRGGEEALELVHAGIPFRFLPGLTSALGALAGAAIPATMRGVNNAIIFATGHSADNGGEPDWARLAATGQPIVVYMGISQMERITAALIEGGLPASTPAAVIMAATRAGGRTVTGVLGDIAAHARAQQIAAPALVVIGGIVSLRDIFLGHRQAQGDAA